MWLFSFARQQWRLHVNGGNRKWTKEHTIPQISHRTNCINLLAFYLFQLLCCYSGRASKLLNLTWAQKKKVEEINDTQFQKSKTKY